LFTIKSIDIYKDLEGTWIENFEKVLDKEKEK
jgi:hypothetical protein